MAVQKLLNLGCKRIGLILDGVVNDRTDGNWVGGYAAKVIRHGMEPLIFFRSSGDSIIPLTKEEAPKLKIWLRKNRPDALIIDYSPPFIDWLKTECRLRIPRDISVVSLNVASDDLFHSGVDQNEYEMGSAAVDLLINLIHTNERGIPAIPRRLLIEGTWREGKTVRKERGNGNSGNSRMKGRT